MASKPCGLVSLNHEEVVPSHANEKHHSQEDDNNNFDYSQRAQWLRAAVLGANDGLVSVTSLMMGVGAVKEDVKAMLLAGFAGSVAGACSIAMGEFVSVYTQYEVELSQMKRAMNREDQKDEIEMGITEKGKKLPNPFQAAFASAFSCCVGALVPLLSAAFIEDYKVRPSVVVAMASLALVVFGGLGAALAMARAITTMIFDSFIVLCSTSHRKVSFAIKGGKRVAFGLSTEIMIMHSGLDIEFAIERKPYVSSILPRHILMYFTIRHLTDTQAF